MINIQGIKLQGISVQSYAPVNSITLSITGITFDQTSTDPSVFATNGQGIYSIKAGALMNIATSRTLLAGEYILVEVSRGTNAAFVIANPALAQSTSTTYTGTDSGYSSTGPSTGLTSDQQLVYRAKVYNSANVLLSTSSNFNINVYYLAYYDNFTGTGTVNTHTPNVSPGTGFIYNIDGTDFSAVMNNYLYSANTDHGSYCVVTYGKSGNSPIVNNNTFFVTWSWNCGTTPVADYYATYFTIRTAAGNLGFNVDQASLNPNGGPSTPITLTANTSYTGSLRVDATTCTMTFLGKTITYPNPNMSAAISAQYPYGTYVSMTTTAKLNYIKIAG